MRAFKTACLESTRALLYRVSTNAHACHSDTHPVTFGIALLLGIRVSIPVNRRF